MFPVPHVGRGTRAHKDTPSTFICVIRRCKSDEMEQGDLLAKQ